jgi:hypothetical protein
MLHFEKEEKRRLNNHLQADRFGICVTIKPSFINCQTNSEKEQNQGSKNHCIAINFIGFIQSL